MYLTRQILSMGWAFWLAGWNFKSKGWFVVLHWTVSFNYSILVYFHCGPRLPQSNICSQYSPGISYFLSSTVSPRTHSVKHPLFILPFIICHSSNISSPDILHVTCLGYILRESVHNTHTFPCCCIASVCFQHCLSHSVSRNWWPIQKYQHFPNHSVFHHSEHRWRW